METSDRLIGVGALIVCLTWSGIKISEYYFKINPPPSQITQPKKNRCGNSLGEYFSKPTCNKSR